MPIAALLLKASSISMVELTETLRTPRVQASLRLTIGASLLAAAINTVFGFIAAWTLVRYRFLGRRLIDSLVDLPFAMPTAVSGIALMAIYAPTGLVGKQLVPFGIKTAISPLVKPNPGSRRTCVERIIGLCSCKPDRRCHCDP